MSSEVIFSQKLEQSVSLIDTVCPYCGVGCGVTAKVQNNQVIGVQGNESHPTNSGRLCVKGSSLDETLGENKRVLAPRINGEQVSWQQATDTVAEKFNQIIDEHGPDSVAFYLSGQLLTEDYYVANKLMKGYIGSGNVDTNSRLCMASASTAHKRAFGEDIVPGCYDDLEQADVLFIVGSNAAYAHPIVYQRIIKAKENKPDMKLVVIDPRGTATSDTADLHLALKPGTDAYFFNGLLSYLAANDGLDKSYIEQHCQGFELALSSAQSQCERLSEVAKICDLELEKLEQAYQLFLSQPKVVTMFSQGINQSSSGVDKGNAIINCHLASGKIGIAGAGPFSITGQPNAMGGREVGGLATQLAAHLHFEQHGAVDLVKRFWDAPNIATEQGLKAVDMFDAVDQGKVKAIWVMATNPVVSLPDADLVKRALAKCDTVIVSECYENADTLAYADIVLPATTWGEKFGTVTNSERRISLQRSLVEAPGEAKHDWQIVTEVAQKMGFAHAFDYQHPVDIFKEHAALSGFENQYYDEEIAAQSADVINRRVFDISALADISQQAYESFSPIQWPVHKNLPYGVKRLFAKDNLDNLGFVTPSQKAQFVGVVARLPKYKAKSNELVMNTGRIRDQWHTMTRTARTKKLLSHQEEPFVQVSPQDAEKYGLQDNGLAQLENLGAKFIGRVKVSEQQREGELFAPIHWNDNHANAARVSALVNPITDPLCGQPEFKHSPVKVAPHNELWSGFIVSTVELNLGEQASYWSKVKIENGYKYLLADGAALPNDIRLVKSLFPHISDWLVFKEDAKAPLRIAGFVDDDLACFFVGDTQTSKQYNTAFIAKHLGQNHDKANRLSLLSGTDAMGVEDVGAIVCTCFQVGEKTINGALKSGECHSVESLGAKLKCGTNCGSCIPELKNLIAKSAC